MAEATEVRRAGPTTVRDVPADEFIKAFSAYLKKTGKVGSFSLCRRTFVRVL